jgi:NAD(P)-dependent dehydrogenase (short-subunit alcohol dehydrogenase family)
VDRGLAGKVALVTGGSCGIGLTTTLAELEQLKVPATSVSANLSTRTTTTSRCPPQ